MRQLKWIAPLVALSLAFGLGLARAEGDAPAAKGSIAVKVTDASGAAVKGAMVSFAKVPPVRHTEKAEGAVPQKPNTRASALKTDENGAVTIENVVPGDYLVRAFDSATKTRGEAKVTVKAGEAAAADIQLKAVGAPKAGGAVTH